MKQLDLPIADERFVAMLRALANPARYRIVQELRRSGVCQTGPLLDVLPLAQSTVSEHLRRLKEVGLVTGDLEGPAICYCIDEKAFAWFQQRVAEL
jgi:ArsR family transcriptional regulator, arsenate/arsenite/antimonite-responsive transcriptional repressor